MKHPSMTEAQGIPAPTTASDPKATPTAGLAGYLKGFGLALLLTLPAFGLVALGTLPKSLVLPILFGLGLLQILVHLHYFLHLDLTSESQPYLLTISFTFLILVIMVGGSLWILYDLHLHTMLPG